MSPSLHYQLVAAVAAKLAAAPASAFPRTITSSWDVLPRYEVQELGDAFHAVVIASERESQTVDREATLETEFDVEVGLVTKVRIENLKVDIPAADAVAEAIQTYLAGLDVLDGFSFVSATTPVPFDTETLRGKQVYLGKITLTYKAHMEA